jgi:hypothetical protein
MVWQASNAGTTQQKHKSRAIIRHYNLLKRYPGEAKKPIVKEKTRKRVNKKDKSRHSHEYVNEQKERDDHNILREEQVKQVETTNNGNSRQNRENKSSEDLNLSGNNHFSERGPNRKNSES